MGKKVIASKEYPKSGETTKQKTVLGTPFEYKWHSLTEGESSMLLTSLVSLLEPVGSKRAAALKTRTDEQAQRRDDERLQLAEAQTTAAENRLKTIKATDLTSLDLAQKEAIRSEQKALEKKLSKKRSSDAPNTPSKRVKLSTDLPPIDDEVCKEIMDSIVLGVNKVTRLLEPQADTSLRLVFVCKGDTTVTHLYSHLPPMVHLAGKGALLVPLPKGAEAALANALGIKSALVLGIKKAASRFDKLYKLVSGIVPPTRIPWLPRNKQKFERFTVADGAMEVDQKDQPSEPTGTSYMETKLKTLNIPDGARISGRGGCRSRGGGSGGRGNSRHNSGRRGKIPVASK